MAIAAKIPHAHNAPVQHAWMLQLRANIAPVSVPLYSTRSINRQSCLTLASAHCSIELLNPVAYLPNSMHPFVLNQLSDSHAGPSLPLLLHRPALLQRLKRIRSGCRHMRHHVREECLQP